MPTAKHAKARGQCGTASDGHGAKRGRRRSSVRGEGPLPSRKLCEKGWGMRALESAAVNTVHDLEAAFCGAVKDAVDESSIVRFEAILKGGGLQAENLQDHVNALFRRNTIEQARSAMGHWVQYCEILYPGQFPAFQDVQWPPTLLQWKAYLRQARVRCSSYTAFRIAMGSVCMTANRFWSTVRCVPVNQVNPREIYQLEHQSCMCEIRRQHGLGVQQVEAITMEEARNGCHFSDPESLRGLAANAAFSMGVLFGGRRPRSLTTVRLKDVMLTVAQSAVNGSLMKVPSVEVVFREEKFDCLQGPRSCTDVPPCAGYDNVMLSGCAFWIYRYLVYRAVFEVFDPLLCCCLESRAGNQGAARVP